MLIIITTNSVQIMFSYSLIHFTQPSDETYQHHSRSVVSAVGIACSDVCNYIQLRKTIQ